MTEKLKQLMHEQALHPHFDPVDVEALVADGDRRIRRRRWGAAAAGTAAAVVVAVAAPALLGGQDRVIDPLARSIGEVEKPVVSGVLPSDMFAQGRVTWAWDSVIHYGDVTVDVGRDVDAFVRTQLGFVFASDGEVWQVDGDVQKQIGSVDAKNPRLVADPETADAGWVDPTGAKPVFVVFDHGTGATQRYDEFTRSDMGLLADEKNPAYFYGLDAHTAYWHDSRGAVATDLQTGEATVVDGDAVNGFDIVDVEDGLLAMSTETGTDFGTSSEQVRSSADGFYGSMGDFSPNAQYYTGDADEPQVFDIAAGKPVTINLDGYAFATGYDWIDDETVAMIASRSERGPVQLLSCVVTTGACTTYADDLGSFEEAAGHFQLPVGETITGD